MRTLYILPAAYFRGGTGQIPAAYLGGPSDSPV
jgi:hypothetical protein